MKRKLLLSCLLSLLLVGCKNTNNITILTPTGAPALAFYTEINNPNFNTNATPKNILAKFNENGEDVIVIDTISGLKAINNGAPYKIAATITFGNFYLASTGNDDNNELDLTDNIVIFGKDQTPDILFNYIYGDGYNLFYVDSVANAAKCLISGKTLDNNNDVDYVFVAEPVLTNALNNNKNATIYHNIQEKYKEKSNGNELIQASVFVKDNTDKNINKYLDNLNNNIDKLLKDSSLLNKDVKDDDFNLKYGINPNIAKKTIENGNRIGLGFKMALDNKENIKAFANLFNVNLNEEKIYKK